LLLQQAIEIGAVNITSTAGLVVINAEVTRQAAILAYLKSFRLIIWISLFLLPVVLLLESPKVEKI
jgi:DHA2 family multidrug resistance protein